MTKMQALYSFFSGFGLNAYEENAIYAADTALPLPYITYSVGLGEWLSGDIPISASIWYRTTSWQEPESKMQQISDAIGYGGIQIPCDGGLIWIKKSNGTFAQMTGDPSDKLIKRIILSISAEYLTLT